MRRFFLAMVLTMSARLVLAQTSDARDGNWWRENSKSSRLDYVVGFFDGMELGHKFSYWQFIKEDGGRQAVRINESYEEYSKRFLSKVTAGQLVDGLDDFYSDYRNRSIRVSNSVWLVLNGIAGTPKVQLDSLIENWRRAASRP